MKLDSETLTYIKNVVETSQLVGIDNVIIEAGNVRAINDEKSVVLFQEENVPEINFNIGLNRIGVFLSRLEVAQTQDNFAVDVKTDDDSVFARSFTMTAKGFKVDYRCANPTTIVAPKQINDTPKTRVQLTGDAVLLLQKGQVAMGADTVTIISNEGVSFEFVDVNNDVFKHTFADDAEALTDDTDTNFAHRYPAKTLLALFKNNPTGTFTVGQSGTLCLEVNGLNITVLPQV